MSAGTARRRARLAGARWEDEGMPDNLPPLPDPADATIAVLGGTGDEGRGLGRRLAAAGNRVLLGSRSADRAIAAAATISDGLPPGRVSGAANTDAAAAADGVIVAVPWDGHAKLLTDLADALAARVVVDCVNPLGFDPRGPYPLPVEEGSATEQAAALLPASRVVGAFHHVAAAHLLDPNRAGLDTDVLVVGDDRPACELVIALAGRIPGIRGVYAGRLRNAGAVEALCANLIAINRRYKAHAGIRITDV